MIGAAAQESLPWLDGKNIKWSDEERMKEANISGRLLAYSHYASRFEDIGTEVELMLSEARNATGADAGKVYFTTPDGKLRLTYFQNSFVLHGRSSARNHYVKLDLPINASSVSGYATITHETVNIPNISQISPDEPWKFDLSFDRSTGYNTISMLTVPVLGTGGKVLAVIQLMNCISELGIPRAFDDAHAHYVEMLAMQAAPYIMKAAMTRRMIDTMLRISEMRDPLETGAHVRRVGSFAAEIYAQWALNKGIGREEIMRDKDTLGLAAMLHDIGKVAIPDAVLKKPARLTDEEYEVIKTHCARGAEMYEAAESPLERMAYEITLYHHQRWDGKGYTGDPNIPNLTGDAIPIWARVTSVADVLDALAFPRVYKPAWSFENVMEELDRCAGTQFDPDVVRAAHDAKETIKAIVDMYL